MNKITPEKLMELAAYEGDSVLTIYMPTHVQSTPPHMSEDQTRYKNLIREGMHQWEKVAGPVDFNLIRTRLEQRLDDQEFWKHMSQSLAIFANEKEVAMYHLPIEVNEQVYVGATYDTVPLLQVETMNQAFYVFALAMHDSKLYRGDLYGLEPVAVDFPQSIEAALNIDEMFINSNTIRAGSGSMREAAHGQGDSQEAGHEERLIYLRMLDQRIIASKHVDHRLPIVIAATDNEAGDFQAISRLPFLLSPHVNGNRTKGDLGELHRLASDIIHEAVTDQHLREAAKRYGELIGVNKAADDIADITKAAEAGRVETLLLNVFNRTRDSVTDSLKSVAFRESEHEKDTMLTLINQVITTGGTIKLMPGKLMPSQATAAAMYRY